MQFERSLLENDFHHHQITSNRSPMYSSSVTQRSNSSTQLTMGVNSPIHSPSGRQPFSLLTRGHSARTIGFNSSYSNNSLCCNLFLHNVGEDDEDDVPKVSKWQKSGQGGGWLPVAPATIITKEEKGDEEETVVSSLPTAIHSTEKCTMKLVPNVKMNSFDTMEHTKMSNNNTKTKCCTTTTNNSSNHNSDVLITKPCGSTDKQEQKSSTTSNGKTKKHISIDKPKKTKKSLKATSTTQKTTSTTTTKKSYYPKWEYGKVKTFIRPDECNECNHQAATCIIKMMKGWYQRLQYKIQLIQYKLRTINDNDSTTATMIHTIQINHKREMNLMTIAARDERKQLDDRYQKAKDTVKEYKKQIMILRTENAKLREKNELLRTSIQELRDHNERLQHAIDKGQHVTIEIERYNDSIHTTFDQLQNQVVPKYVHAIQQVQDNIKNYNSHCRMEKAIRIMYTKLIGTIVEMMQHHYSSGTNKATSNPTKSNKKNGNHHHKHHRHHHSHHHDDHHHNDELIEEIVALVLDVEDHIPTSDLPSIEEYSK